MSLDRDDGPVARADAARPTSTRVSSRIGVLIPGTGLAVAGAVTARATAPLVNGLSPLVVGLALGVAFGNLRHAPERLRPGLRFVSRRILQGGVVLLGLRLAIGDLAAIGLPGLLAVVATVGVTFGGTRWLARKLSLRDGLGLLVATGFSICGVSAIAAMEAATDSDEDDVAVAAVLVTLCGTLAIAVLPLLGTALGLSPAAYGTWTGASVHDVAQVLAAASPFGPQSIERAVMVKLTRVILLAPLVMVVASRHQPSDRSTGQPGTARNRVPIPGFVLGFLACAALRSAGLASPAILGGAKVLEGLLITTAMVGVGTAVRVSRLRLVGIRPLILGFLSWGLIASFGFGVARLTT